MEEDYIPVSTRLGKTYMVSPDIFKKSREIMVHGEYYELYGDSLSGRIKDAALISRSYITPDLKVEIKEYPPERTYTGNALGTYYIHNGNIDLESIVDKVSKWYYWTGDILLVSDRTGHYFVSRTEPKKVYTIEGELAYPNPLFKEKKSGASAAEIPKGSSKDAARQKENNGDESSDYAKRVVEEFIEEVYRKVICSESNQFFFLMNEFKRSLKEGQTRKAQYLRDRIYARSEGEKPVFRREIIDRIIKKAEEEK